MNELNAESNRLVGEENQLVSALLASPTRSPNYGLWAAIAAILPVVWLSRQSYLTARASRAGHRTSSVMQHNERPFIKYLRLITVAVVSPVILFQAIQGLHDAKRWGLPDHSLIWNWVLIVFAAAVGVWCYWRLVREVLAARGRGGAA